MFCPICGVQVPEDSQACVNPACSASKGVANPFATTQPRYNQYGGGFNAPYVPDYLVWSILELLFCCLPLGIVGLVYSIQANSAKTQGRYQEALEMAKKAKTWLMVGLIGWAVIVVFYIMMVVLMAVAGVQGMEQSASGPMM